MQLSCQPRSSRNGTFFVGQIGTFKRQINPNHYCETNSQYTLEIRISINSSQVRLFHYIRHELMCDKGARNYTVSTAPTETQIRE